MRHTRPDDCPCGAKVAYTACCGRYLDGSLYPNTAEALMRSRYVAYVRGRADYLLHTWHPSTRPASLDLSTETGSWLGLKVLRVEAGGAPSRIIDERRKMGYWLLKSEPQTFSLADLETALDRTTPWEGVRNYQARNFLRDGLQVGDEAFFYHSGTAQPAIVGIVEVVRAGYPDPTAFDPASPYNDPGSRPDHPRWYRVDVRLVRRLRRAVTLAELKHAQDALGDFALLRRGNRLSVLPVTAAQWAFILGREDQSPP
jgi:predicted RNA-binding protein with PUA-like domain